MSETTTNTKPTPNQSSRAESREIPAGYKQTALGIIPEIWEVKILGDEIEELEAGVSVNSIDEPICEGDLCILKTSAISNGLFHKSEVKKILPSDINRAKLNPRKDSILISRMNTPDLVGECGYVSEDYPNLFLPDRLWQTIFFKYSTVNSKWLNYLLNSTEYKLKIKSSATGTSNSMKNISKSSFLLMKVAIPPLPEQQKIAEILCTWDKAIDTCKKTIKKLKKRNRGLGEQLLSGKKRMKGFEGEAKKEFHVLGNYINEVTVKNKDLKTKRVLSVTNSRGFINQSDQFEREVASADVSNYKIVKKGQFAYNPSRVNVGSLDLLRNFEEGILSPMYVVFETNEKKLLPDFLNHHLKTYWFKGHIPMFVQGSVRDSLSFDGLCGMKFFIPSLEEQQAITSIMDIANAELKQYEQKLLALQLQKKGLMEELLTGKTRVKV